MLKDAAYPVGKKERVGQDKGCLEGLEHREGAGDSRGWGVKVGIPEKLKFAGLSGGEGGTERVSGG